MKTIPFLLTLAITVGAASGALASDKKHTQTSKPQVPAKAKTDKVKASEQQEQTALTGSYIKRNVRRAGVITDGPTPTYVLDQKAIQTSGGADLSQVLIRAGFRR